MTSVWLTALMLGVATLLLCEHLLVAVGFVVALELDVRSVS